MSPDELKRRTTQAPRRGAFVGGAGGEHTGFVERPSGELEGERKAVAAEAAAYGKRGLASDVERHAEGGLAQEVEDLLRLLKNLRRAPLIGRHHQVVAAHGGACVDLQLATEAYGREILLGGEEGAELEAAARRVAELLRGLDHLLAMDGMRLGGDDDASANVIVPDIGED